MRHHLYLYLFLFHLLVTGCSAQQKKEKHTARGPQPPNIILLVGDGMGLSQLSSAYYFGEGEPNFSKFPVVGLSRTSSSSHKITDSAAGATAFSCGIKTYNGAIGMDPDTMAVPTIMEQLSEKGWNTGIIATSSVTHATPASFYAHVPMRSMEEEIARQMVYSDLDFVAGGGYGWFVHRSDSVNYLDSLTARGFAVDTTSLNVELGTDGKRPVYLLASDGMPTMLEGRGDFLSDATRKALAHLSARPEPFILQVEGSQIDWGGHANNAEYLISEVLDFDKAVGTAFDFAQEQGNTLVIVTADHETGGFTLAGKQTKVAGLKAKTDYNRIAPTFSTPGHSATMVPVLSSGPESDRLMGIYQNTHIHEVMMEAAQKQGE